MIKIENLRDAAFSWANNISEKIGMGYTIEKERNDYYEFHWEDNRGIRLKAWITPFQSILEVDSCWTNEDKILEIFKD